MDSANGPEGEIPIEQRDLVVVDREALRQLLSAVANTLQASQSLDAMEPPEDMDAERFEQVKETVTQARTALLDGIARIAESVEELPRAQVQPADEDRADD